MKKTYTFQIFKNKHKEFFWRITHKNGCQICRSSETYKRRIDCLRGYMRMVAAMVAGKVGEKV